MLGEDEADDAIALGYPLDRRRVEVVVLAAEAKADVGRDQRDASAGIELVEELQDVGGATGADVGEVDENSLGNHRADKRAAELGEPNGGLREEEVVDEVGEEGDGVRVGGDEAVEEVGDRDVGDPPAGQLADVALDLLGGGAEVEAALDAVDEGEL